MASCITVDYMSNSCWRIIEPCFLFFYPMTSVWAVWRNWANRSLMQHLPGCFASTRVRNREGNSAMFKVGIRAFAKSSLLPDRTGGGHLRPSALSTKLSLHRFQTWSLNLGFVNYHSLVHLPSWMATSVFHQCMTVTLKAGYLPKIILSMGWTIRGT